MNQTDAEKGMNLHRFVPDDFCPVRQFKPEAILVYGDITDIMGEEIWCLANGAWLTTRNEYTEFFRQSGLDTLPDVLFRDYWYIAFYDNCPAARKLRRNGVLVKGKLG